MSDEPDFLREIPVRPLALLNAGCALAAYAGFVALTLAVPALRQEVVWLVGLAVAGVLGLVVVAVMAGRVLRGGCYRVLIRGGRLSVASPSLDFGPDFEVTLAAITRLVITTDEGDRRYIIETDDGQRLDVYSDCGPEVFDALRRLRPEVRLDDVT